jgi:hypothetical protein
MEMEGPAWPTGCRQPCGDRGRPPVAPGDQRARDRLRSRHDGSDDRATDRVGGMFSGSTVPARRSRWPARPAARRSSRDGGASGRSWRKRSASNPGRRPTASRSRFASAPSMGGIPKQGGKRGLASLPPMDRAGGSSSMAAHRCGTWRWTIACMSPHRGDGSPDHVDSRRDAGNGGDLHARGLADTDGEDRMGVEVTTRVWRP